MNMAPELPPCAALRYSVIAVPTCARAGACERACVCVRCVCAAHVALDPLAALVAEREVEQRAHVALLRRALEELDGLAEVLAHALAALVRDAEVVERAVHACRRTAEADGYSRGLRGRIIQRRIVRACVSLRP